MTFKQMRLRCEAVGLELEPDSEYPGHPYCVYYNSVTGVKEIYCRTLGECEQAKDELVQMKKAGV